MESKSEEKLKSSGERVEEEQQLHSNNSNSNSNNRNDANKSLAS